LKKPTWQPQTVAAQAGGHVDPVTGAIVPPIQLASTFERDPDNAYRRGYIYARPDNPNVRVAEEVLQKLEGAAVSMLMGSGMAAATTAFLALDRTPDRPAHVVAPNIMYWALKNWLANSAPTLGIHATFVDATNPYAIAAAIRPGETRMVWLETPANPMWGISDIAAAAEAAHKAGALLGVDSTVATPVLTQPIALGADIVMHSATKYLNGHSDIIAGALLFAREDAMSERAKVLRSGLGAVLSPFDASLLLRGLRTLHLRVAHQSSAALTIARHFAGHRRVAEVLYPGLPGPGHNVAARQMHGGFSGMLSIRVTGGEAASIAAAARVELWKRATSLGGVESLIEHRASVEGAGTPCPPDLLRLSVGLEDPADLIADLEQALS
jgi:cystathionine gamma-synthase